MCLCQNPSKNIKLMAQYSNDMCVHIIGNYRGNKLSLIKTTVKVVLDAADCQNQTKFDAFKWLLLGSVKSSRTRIMEDAGMH